jgi:uncharacterized protein YtpQ (UPF0354 family)
MVITTVVKSPVRHTALNPNPVAYLKQVNIYHSSTPTPIVTTAMEKIFKNTSRLKTMMVKAMVNTMDRAAIKTKTTMAATCSPIPNVIRTKTKTRATTTTLTLITEPRRVEATVNHAIRLSAATHVKNTLLVKYKLTFHPRPTTHRKNL